MEQQASGQITVAAVASGYPLSSSTEYNADHSVHRARLDYPTPREGSQAWCAGTSDINQWLQVNFIEPRLVTAVETQGRGDYDQWVTRYVVKHSVDGINWYIVDGAHEFVGN